MPSSPLLTPKSPTPYWKKQDSPLFKDTEWNIPEQPTAHFAIIGGNAGSFVNVARTAEFMAKNFPLKSLKIILPDSLERKIPAGPDFIFAPSTPSGSFATSATLENTLKSAEATLFIGDFSKNEVTAATLADILKTLDTPTVITRDTIDLLAPHAANFIEQNSHLIIIASLAQLQKLFRALYYPKVLLLSMPLLQVVEALHKFTLTYPCTLLTFHDNQILIASSGQIISTPIAKTTYSPLSLWQGQLAAKALALNFYNPGHPLEATAHAIFL